MKPLAAFCGCLALVVGCNRTENTQAGKTVVGLKRFESPQEMKTYLKDQIDAQNQFGFRDGLFGLGGLPAPLALPDVDASANDAAGQAAAPPSGAEGGGGDVSQTNLQEAGVDEGDIVKNDGRYIYVMSGETIRIVAAETTEPMSVASTISLNGYGTGMYLRGDRLVAMSQPYSGIYYLGAPGIATDAFVTVEPYFYNPEIQITIFDIADRANPHEMAKLTLEGNLSASRMIGPNLHLVMTMYLHMASPTEFDADQTDLDEILPDYRLEAGSEAMSEGNISDWSDFYHPLDPDGYGVVSVVTVNTDDPMATPKSVSIMADPGEIYASTTSLYLTNTMYDYSGETRQTTDLYKFDLTGEQPAFVAAGSVVGRVLNQFSMGEYEGALRIATTSDDFGAGFATASANHVFVLQEDAGELRVVGSLDDIATGERIYAARFLGPRGFLVTFRNVDPLFTLDMSDPTQPKIEGELKVPGFSQYLQLIDENHLLAIGRDAEDLGDFARPLGIQLSLFDISDFANPQLQDSVIIGGSSSYSEALYDHKAFTYLASRRALAFPVDIYPEYTFWEGDVGEGDAGGATDANSGSDVQRNATVDSDYFSGIYAFEVDTDLGFREIGRLSTSMEEDAPYYYGGGVRRAVFMGDALYAVGEAAVIRVALDNLEGGRQTLVLETYDDQPIPFPVPEPSVESAPAR